MAYRTMTVGGVDVKVDESTGAILVAATDLASVLALLQGIVAGGMMKVSIAGGSAVINVDMAEVDVTALINGIAGNKKLQDLDARLATLDGNTSRLNVLAIKRITFTATGNGDTLETLLAGALNASLKRLTIITDSSGVYYAAGNASASTSKLPAVLQLDINKTVADTLKFYDATASIQADVIQEG